MFKKNPAIVIDKMNQLRDVVITNETVKFSLDYSAKTLELKEVPKLLSDVMQLYVYAKPLLDKQQAEKLKKEAKSLNEQSEDIDSGNIDLDSIPF